MLPEYPTVRTAALAASDRRSSPRALCLLHPDLRPAAGSWGDPEFHLAALGERGADPERTRGRRSGARPNPRSTSGDALAFGPALALARSGTSELLAWLAARRCGPAGLCFRLDHLALADRLPRSQAELEIPLDEQRWLLELAAYGDRLTHFQRLGLAPTVDQAAIRRAYLMTCQRLHPDRYYGKHIGRFAALLVDLFHRARVAQAYLADPRRCARYVALLAAAGHAVADASAPA